MQGFFCWLIDDKTIYANVFTLLTVALSGGISLIISALFFNMGNRSNLRASVLYPMKLILAEQSSGKNYAQLVKLSQNYTVRYLHKKERERMETLLTAYKNGCRYSYESMCADCLYSYFNYTLEKNGVSTTPVPIVVDGDVVDMDFPTDVLYMADDIANWLEKNQQEFDDADKQNGIISIFDGYCKRCYTDKKISFFEDVSYEEVIEKAKAHKEWVEKIKTMNAAKKAFLDMSIVK